MVEINKNKSLLVLFVLALFCSSSAFSTNVIDMRSPEKVDEVKDIVIEQSEELVLFNNYIDTFNVEKFVTSIAPYYNSIVLTLDDYSMTVYFNDNGIDKIVDGMDSNYDVHIELDKENVRYLTNNWYSMNTFDKIKYIINLDIPVGETIKLAGIAMSVR